MPRMKDMIKGFDQPNDDPIQKETKPPSQPETARLSGLDAIRQAIEENLRKGSSTVATPPRIETAPPAAPATPQRPVIPSPPPPPRFETRPTQASFPQIPTSAFAPKPAQTPIAAKKLETDDEELLANQLYMDLHLLFQQFVDDIKNRKPINPKPIEEKLPDFCRSVSSNEYMFLKAIQRKRFATWIVSHSVNVAIFATKIGFGLKYKPEEMYQLALSAFMHDLGMTAVPNRILFKQGQLSSDELNTVKHHPIDGLELVRHLKKEYAYILDVVYQEHERDDGSGYPQGLKGDEITEYAKIIGIADVFEAMVHGRAYRDGFITYQALQSIIKGRTGIFSPKIIRALISVISMFPVGSIVKLNTGERARVISINRNRPVRPIVEISVDSEGRKLEPPLRLNLETEPLIYITETINE